MYFVLKYRCSYELIVLNLAFSFIVIYHRAFALLIAAMASASNTRVPVPIYKALLDSCSITENKIDNLLKVDIQSTDSNELSITVKNVKGLYNDFSNDNIKLVQYCIDH